MVSAAMQDGEVKTFWHDGFLLRESFADSDTTLQLRRIAEAHLDQQLAPIEYEVDVQYPGAPASAEAAGADTSRRLLQAYSRHGNFRRWASGRNLYLTLAKLFADSTIRLSQCHHNCIMTKQPGYSSVTRWHQDNRYWSFDEQNLISVWLALSDENTRNGCLRVIPGSHRLELQPGQFDAAQFLRTDLTSTKSLAGSAVSIEMHAGDVLFFHSKLIHAAGRNLTDATKYSLVFTYHTANNHPIMQTRSARFPSIGLDGAKV